MTATAPPYPVVGDLGAAFGAIAIALAAPAPAIAFPPHPAAHFVAARALGGVRFAARQHPACVLRLPDWPELRVVAVTPQIEWDPMTVKHALPREVPMMKHARQVGVAAAVVLAFERRDAALLRDVHEDAVVGAAVGPRLPGFFPAASAAIGEGALLFALTPPGPTVVALALAETAGAVREAITYAFAGHAIEVVAVTAAVAACVDPE